MTAQQLLADLAELGVSVEADEHHLRLRPKSRVPPGLVERLRANKTELLPLLKRRPVVAESLPGGVVDAQATFSAAAVCSMPLSEFAQARLVVEVYSDVLAETVVFASDNARVDPGERRVVYRAAELHQLLEVSAEDLRHIHLTKAIFGGSVEPC